MWDVITHLYFVLQMYRFSYVFIDKNLTNAVIWSFDVTMSRMASWMDLSLAGDACGQLNYKRIVHMARSRVKGVETGRCKAYDP